MRKIVVKLCVLSVMAMALIFVPKAKADDTQCHIDFIDCMITYCYNPIDDYFYYDCVDLRCLPKYDQCIWDENNPQPSVTPHP